MATPAVFDTGFIPVGLTQPSYIRQFVRYSPNGSAPLFALSGMVQTKEATQNKHGYWGKTLVFPKVTLNAAVADGAATSFTVLSTANILPGDLLRANTTGEIVLVTQVNSGTALTVVRGRGNVAAAAIGNTVPLYKVGNAFEQASVRPQSLNINPVNILNYTQIFRNSWSLSGTAAAISTEAGDGNLAENKRDAMFFHAADIETALFFGQKLESTRNNQVYMQMDGLESVIRQYAPGNITTAGSTTTYDQLEAMLDPCFNQVTDAGRQQERMLFVGSTALKVINAIGRKTGQYQIIAGQTEFGMQYETFKISRGRFRMMEHPIFNSNPHWSSMAVAVDLTTFDLAYLKGRKTFHKTYGSNGDSSTNDSDDGIDAMGGTLTTELTTEIKNPAANAIIYGLTAAA